MALSLTELNAITHDYCDKTTTDIYFQDNILLYLLMSGGRMKENLVTPADYAPGGTAIRVILEHASSNTGSYGKNTTITQAKVDILNAARFRWAGYFSSNAIDLDDKVQNNNDMAWVKLIQAKIDNIRKSIRDKMGTDIYASAANTDSFLGLGNLFNTTTSTTYGEIAEDDMAQWKANAITAAASFTFSELQYMRRTPAIGQNEAAKPNLYITTEELRDSYENTLTTQARYKDQKLIDVGFSNILFSGAPVVADDKQTAGYCDGLNLRFLKIMTHPDYAFTKPVWEHDKETPDTEVANIRFIGQLVTKHRKAHVRHTNLS